MQRSFAVVLLSLLVSQPAFAAPGGTSSRPSPRPPAVPLITHDPFFSVWSVTDELTAAATQHWSGVAHPLSGLIRVDGRTFRFLGAEPRTVPPAKQIDLTITPTSTRYTFTAAGVRLVVTFLSPLIPSDLDLYARPVTYVTLAATSLDRRPLATQVLFDASADLAVHNQRDKVIAARVEHDELVVLRVGTEDQPVLKREGDGVRIDWGHLYLAVSRGAGVSGAIGRGVGVRSGFAATGSLAADDPAIVGRAGAASLNDPVLALAMDLGRVGPSAVERSLLVAYDQVHAVELMGEKLRPWWRRDGGGPLPMLAAAARERAEVVRRAAAFDAELTTDLTAVGGATFATVSTLSFRQALAAHSLVADAKGRPLYFSKENYSGGFIATVDVTYPSAPMMLLFNPKLLAGQLIPVLDYAASPRWPHPFAPHDLGVFPRANGQKYGDGEKGLKNQMPVEESGNLLILAAALVQVSGDRGFAKQYQPLFARWAAYLADRGLDPENQLCTDDFAGHLAHNTNLSLKAVLALGAYARLAEVAGQPGEAAKYRGLAIKMANDWQRLAADGDHFRLTFDGPGSWSQKYNLVWDDLLGLDLFPAAVARQEIAFYKTKLERFGLPLDSRSTYTKLDWHVWIAALTENRADFSAFIDPLARFIDESPTRGALTDWYDTVSGRRQGFVARSVVGGVFIPLLRDPALWKKWAGRAAR